MIRYGVGDDHVARLTLDRPDTKNTLTVEIRDEIVARVQEARADPAVRALLLTGTGDAFCSGMDLSASTMVKAAEPDFETRSTAEALRVGVQRFIEELWQLDKPTVAAVNGAAVGPGAHLAFGLRLRPRPRRHPVPVDVRPLGAGHRRGRRVPPPPPGRSPAGEGDGDARGWRPGAEAVDLGLAYRCVPKDAARSHRDRLAARLAAGPTRSLGLSKRLLNASFETSLERSLEARGRLPVAGRHLSRFGRGDGGVPGAPRPRLHGSLTGSARGQAGGVQ